jgi:hypothetical protein
MTKANSRRGTLCRSHGIPPDNRARQVALIKVSLLWNALNVAPGPVQVHRSYVVGARAYPCVLAKLSASCANARGAEVAGTCRGYRG